MRFDRLHFSKEKTIGIFPVCGPHNSAQCQPSVTEVSEQDRARFTRKRKAAVSGGIWTILPWLGAEFCKLAGGIWQNFPRKTVGPNHHFMISADSFETVANL